MALKAILLCAGLGTRLRPYTHQLPKPCIPFLGIPLLQYSLYLLKKHHCMDVVINLHHLPEKIKKLTEDSSLQDFQFTFTEELEKPLGSGGALFNAKKHLEVCDHFFAINGDEVMVPTSDLILKKLQDHHVATGAIATLLVTDHPDLMKTLKPVWVNNEGVIRGFGEKPVQREMMRPVHYTGYKIFSRDIFKFLPPGESHIFHEAVMPAVQAGHVANTLFDACDWWETGDFVSFLKATTTAIEMIATQKDKNHFMNIYKSFKRDFDFDVSVQPGHVRMISKSVQSPTSLNGTVFIDQGAKFKDNVQLDNVIINKNADVSQSLKEQMIL